jgi:hypothetical protein
MHNNSNHHFGDICDYTYSLGFPTMRDKIVNRDFNTFEMFQTLQSFAQQFEVKRVWMVKVILVFCCLMMLFIS